MRKVALLNEKVGEHDDVSPDGVSTLTNNVDLSGRVFDIWRKWMDVSIPKLMNKPEGEHFYWNFQVDDVMERQKNAVSEIYKFENVDKFEKIDDDWAEKVALIYGPDEEGTDWFMERRSVGDFKLEISKA